MPRFFRLFFATNGNKTSSAEVSSDVVLVLVAWSCQQADLFVRGWLPLTLLPQGALIACTLVCDTSLTFLSDLQNNSRYAAGRLRLPELGSFESSDGLSGDTITTILDTPTFPEAR